jgi:hypothetical protein
LCFSEGKRKESKQMKTKKTYDHGQKRREKKLDSYLFFLSLLFNFSLDPILHVNERTPSFLFALSNSWLNHANSFIITRFQTLHSISIIFLFFCFILILNLWIKSTNSIMLMPNTDLWSNVLFACQISNCISVFSICAWIRCMIC